METNSHEEKMEATAPAAAMVGITTMTETDSGYEQPDLSLSPDKQEEFDQCCEVLHRHQRNVPMVGRAIATIDREGYYAFYPDAKYKNANDFIHEVFGFERTYIHRMKKYGYWLLEDDIPEGREPSETGVREMLQNAFSPEDRKKIYRDAREICLRRRKKDSKKSSMKSEEKRESDSESSGGNTGDAGDGGDGGESCAIVNPEEIAQIVPEAKDIREALTNFKKASGRIYFSLLDNKSYAKDTTFQQILEENADKFKSIRTVLDCFQHYKAVTDMTLVPPETAQAVRNCIAKLIDEAKDEMEALLRDPSSSTDTDTI